MFKSRTHINVVKSGDIRQGSVVYRLRPSVRDQAPEQHLNSSMTQMMDMEEAEELPRELQIGLTPPIVAGSASLPRMCQ